jgi:ATP synthase protein I
MQEGPDPVRLKKLEERIAAAKRATQPKPRVEEHYSAASQGWRMVIELVSGMGLGFGIGYGLDVLLGTLPIFLVLFALLGFAAGVKVMLRTAREFQAGQEAGPPAKKDEGE